MPGFASSVVRSASFSVVAGMMLVATMLVVCIAGVSALAATASMICTVIIAVGPVVPPLVHQWQRVRILRKVLDKVDSVDDAAKLLQATRASVVGASTSRFRLEAPVSFSAANPVRGSPAGRAAQRGYPAS